MPISSLQNLLYLIGAICLLWITGFLCWLLYELAILGRQTNQMLRDTRGKINRVEAALMGISEKFSTVSQYLGILAQGGHTLMRWLRKKKMDGFNEEFEEEMEYEIPRGRKRR